MSKTFSILLESVKTYMMLSSKKCPELFKTVCAPKIFKHLTITDNFFRLPSQHTIFLANYPAQRLEYMLQGIFPRDLCLIASARASRFVSMIYPEEQLILLPEGGNNFEMARAAVRDKIKQYDIFVYVNDNHTRMSEYHVGKLRKGMFHIAHELGIPITPVAISHIEPVLGALINQKVHIRVGPTTSVADPHESMISTKQFLQDNLRRFRDM